MSGTMRVLGSLVTVAALSVTTQIALSPAAHAADPIENCRGALTDEAFIGRDVVVPGNAKQDWPEDHRENRRHPRRLRIHDVVRFTARGSVQIATWGDHKGPWGNGWDDLAPDNGRWPAPGEPKYALLVRPVAARVVILDGPDRGLVLRPGAWYVAGEDSECMRIVRTSSRDDVTPRFEFKINDDNVGDNNDGFDVFARVWRSCVPPIDSGC
ncbi:hypothetical protein ACFFMN_06115 [Planobispora siamensis]|uniref:Secreted protein n=1 Tax=Planobispora siamensis TaxID=936338 RepID=A0A8J3SKT8_9ACTN|nr:hypothetical protein [Planobispora siamensis]GIH94240.1 hypothetical protein Psi01_48700 [Planobispora siamensis]